MKRTKDAWKCSTTEDGELFAAMDLTTLTPEYSAINSASGAYMN